MTDIQLIEEFPEKDDAEFGWHVANASVGIFDLLFPGLGYGAQQIVQRVVPNPLQKRQTAWLNSLREKLSELATKYEGLKPEELIDREDFVTAIVEITPLAIKTHREKKRKAFENVVLNTAIGITIDDALKGKFLSCLDRFSEGHIVALNIFANPTSYPLIQTAIDNFHMGSKLNVFQHELSVSGIKGDILDVIISDLQQERLIVGNLKIMMSKEGASQPDATSLGYAFLKFISHPQA